MGLYLGPDGSQRLGDILRTALNGQWTSLQFAVAYARLSGIDQLYSHLQGFLSTKVGCVSATIGIDQGGTSYEALSALLGLFASSENRLFICHNPRSSALQASPTFHPKVWLFGSPDGARLVVGSGNLTLGGLYSNCELGTVQDLSFVDEGQRRLFQEAERVLSRWTDIGRGDVRVLDTGLLDALYAAGLVPSEDEVRRTRRAAVRLRAAAQDHASTEAGFFHGEDVAASPVPSIRAPRIRPAVRTDVGSTSAQIVVSRVGQILPLHAAFYIHLSTRAKTEIYLAQRPLREDPAFFGLPFTGQTAPRGQGNPPQPQANPWPVSDIVVYGARGILIEEKALPTKMWQYLAGPNANKDVRIFFRTDIQERIEDGSVCVVQREPRSGVDYAFAIYSPQHPDFPRYDEKCVTPLPNSRRRYGWS